MAASPNPTSPTRPTPKIRRTLYLIGIAVWATGVLYWTFDKYMLQRSDAGLSENPLQVWWLRLHAAAAMTAVWLFGYLCAIHVQRNWGGGVRRNSGALLVSVFALLAGSGYLIYYVEADRPLAMLLQAHWLLGLFAPLAFLLHWGLRWRLGARHLAGAPLAPQGTPAVGLAPPVPATPAPAGVSAARAPTAGLID